MQADQLKQRIERIEEYADEAKRVSQDASVPQQLKDSIMQLHGQASATKHATQGQESATEDSLRRDVLQLEEAADRAMQACRTAGDGVDQQVQQAVQRAHAETSSLKKDLMQEA